LASVQTEALEHQGTCDGSAGVALDEHRFLMANDEDSKLRVYARDTGGPPVQTFDLTAFLSLNDDPEPDIEGATRIGNRAWWITSHGRDKQGAPRPSRQRFFATDIETTMDPIQLAPVGKPYMELLKDLNEDPRLSAYRLADAARLGVEVKGALNIEGLAATPENHLLIGFRSPVPEGKALIVPLENPNEVVEGKARPRFGDPFCLDLGGLGIRGIEYWKKRSVYVIIAGSPQEEGMFQVYLWSGKKEETPVPGKGVEWNGLVPETVLIYRDEQKVQFLSDDGARRLGGKKCKDVAEAQRSFRSFWLVP
jgi:hypothetical protein